ncbi:MAG: hypothetical protein PQJ46_17480, partial [Spirochaetales bacterium]|nr:hypothetical protein [Spirochaetales bacterium]
MKAEEFNLEQFLKSNMLTLDEYDFQRDIDVFIKEMEKGLETESSIPMFPTFIEDDNSIPSNKPVLVLDAGG